MNIRLFLTLFLFGLLGLTQSSRLPTSRQAAPPVNQCPEAQECLSLLSSNFTQCDTLPIPPTSLAVPTGPDGFTLTLNREGVWTYYDGSYLGMMFAGGTHFVFIDFPDTVGSNKLDGSMTRVTDAAEEIIGEVVPTRIDMVYSHSHYDHIGAGNLFFDYMSDRYPMAEFAFWGTEEVQRMIARSPSQRAPEPTEFVDREGSIINLGDNLQLNLNRVNGHSRGDIIAYVPPSNEEPGVLMHVDVILAGYAPFLAAVLPEDFGAFIDVHEEILRRDFEIFIGGHNQLGTRADVVMSQEYLGTLVEAASEATAADISEVTAPGIAKFEDPTAVEFGNAWFRSLNVVRKAQLDICYRRIIERWGCTFSGADITGRSMCTIALDYVQFDL